QKPTSGSAARLPGVQGVGLFLFVSGAVGLFDQRETLRLIEPASLRVALEGPEAQATRPALGNLQQRRADAAALRRRQDVELIDPAFTKRNNANQSLMVEVTPQLTRREHALSEKPSILLGCVKPCKVGKCVIERCPMDGSSEIHVCHFKLPKHPVLP